MDARLYKSEALQCLKDYYDYILLSKDDFKKFRKEIINAENNDKVSAIMHRVNQLVFQ